LRLVRLGSGRFGRDGLSLDRERPGRKLSGLVRDKAVRDPTVSTQTCLFAAALPGLERAAGKPDIGLAAT